MMRWIEDRGDIEFYDNGKGKRFQKITFLNTVYPISDGKSLLHIEDRGKFSIFYNLNGKYGFCVYEGEKKIVDNLWSLSEIDEYLGGK